MLEHLLLLGSLASLVDERLGAAAVVLCGALFALKRAVLVVDESAAGRRADGGGEPRDVGVRVGDTLVAVLRGPPGVAFVFLHGMGGSIRRSLRMRLVQQLAERGSVVLSERRGFGGATFHIDANVDTAVDDGATALLVAASLAPRVVVVGFSLGACVALRLAARLGVPTVLIGAFYDARALTATSLAQLALSHLAGLSNAGAADTARAAGARVQIVHSVDDEFVPFWHALRLSRALSHAPPGEVVRIGGAHADPLLPGPFLDKLLLL